MKRWLSLLIPVVVLGSLVAWRIAGKRAEMAAQGEQRAMRMKMAPLVSLAPVVVKDVVQTLQATGTIEAPQNVKISPKVTGLIEYLPFHEGDRVKKGEVLVRIDPSEAEAQVQLQQAAVAEAEYRLAQAQLNQNPTDVSVSAQIRQQEAAVASATADYNQVSRNYEAQVAAAKANVSDAQARIDNANAARNSADANLLNATTRLNRLKELLKKGFVPAQDVDDANAAVAVQKAAVEIAKGQVNSAIAQKNAAVQQEAIVERKGKADIEAAKARLTQAKAALEYAEANSAQKPAYRQSIAALKASVEAAKASLRSAQVRRRDTVLISPLDGFVTSRYVDQGTMASPGQPILAVQFMKQIWVTVSVPEEVSSKLHINQPAEVTVDALPKRVFRGSIIQLNPSADPQSRQFTVRVILSNPGDLLKPGMYARVSLETDRVKQAVVVPREAVHRDQEGPFVMAVDKGGVAHRRSVITGAEDNDSIAIVGRVRPGDKVITMSAFPVRDGMPVKAGCGRPGGKGGPPGGRRSNLPLPSRERAGVRGTGSGGAAR